MTKEQENISRKNHDEAVKYFEEIGLLPTDRKPYEYVLHHKDKEMRHNDIERYIQWNVEDLEVMTRGEHTKLHYDDIFTEENREKMKTQQGKEPWNKGAHYHFSKKRRPHTEEEKKHLSEVLTGRQFSEEHKKKISESTKGRKGASTGKHWYNNGERETYDFTCPPGFQKGRLSRHKRYAELSQIESDRSEG